MPSVPDDALPRGWSLIDADDGIWEPPVPVEVPLTTTRPTEIDFEALGWQDFERLICWLVPQVQRTESVYRYGRSGQAQHGIDVACLPPDGEPMVFQTKRYQRFGASDLRTAIEDFVNGERPLGARRFVVTVACNANDTATVNMLRECQRRHPDFHIELWDRSVLSRLLVRYPDIVEQFFGEHTRRAFCGEPTSGDPVSRATLSDYVMRGPIRHLGLSPLLSQAENDVAERPLIAADRLGEIASALEGASFAGHAEQFRLRQADSLELADDIVTANEIRLSVAWALIDTANLWTANVAARKIRKAAQHLPEPMLRALNALGSVVAARLGPGPELADIAEAVDALEAGDPHRDLGLLALAEEALAAHRLDFVRHRAGTMQTAIDELSSNEAAPLLAARLGACIADATGEWPQLMLHARTHWTPEIGALVCARHGRYAAQRGDVDLAVERYQQAIRAATDAQNYGDAWAWLYALRSACSSNDQLVSDAVGDPHRIAETVRAHGDSSVLPNGRTRAQALARLNSQDQIAAYEAIRRHVRHSTVAASLSEEMEAHQLFGQLLARTGRLTDAVQHYILAGDGEAATRLADHWPDEAFSLDADISGLPGWQRAAGFKTVVAFEDWLPEPDRAQWAGSALLEILGDPGAAGQSRQRAPQAAYGALAATASDLAVADAEQFLEQVQADLKSERAKILDADACSVTVLYEIARSHPELASRVVAAAMKLFLRVPYRSHINWTEGYDVLRRHQQIVREHLAAEVQTGDLAACIVMAAAGCLDEPVLDQARRRLEHAVSPPEREPGVQHIGSSLPDDAYLIRHLEAEALHRFATASMALAIDPEEPIPNRNAALGAAEACMSEIPESQRSDFFETAMECARGLHDNQGSAPLPLGDTDPLNRFRISFGPRSLQAPGLRCAAASAVTNEQHRIVRGAALELLIAADKYTADSAALAAAQLPATVLAGDIDTLRLRPDPQARALAAIAWADLDDSDEHVGRSLAMDPSHTVRASLASALRDNPAHDALRQQLSLDIRRTVRRVAFRRSQ